MKITMEPNEILARAFHDDPFISWAEPDPARRPRTMATVFAGMLEYSRHRGGSLVEPDVGAVEWRDGRSAHMGPISVVTSGTWRVAMVAPPAVWMRLSAHEDAAMERVQRHLEPGSVYLCTLGVEPAVAGQGHGSRLLQRALREQAARWTRCVLRTEQPRNVPFYLRNGFTQVDDHVVAKSGLRSWVFSRSLASLIPEERR